MADAGARRAERRKQRILENPEDRMKRIFGGQNYHDEHLTLGPTNNIEEEQPQMVEPIMAEPSLGFDMNDPMIRNLMQQLAFASTGAAASTDGFPNEQDFAELMKIAAGVQSAPRSTSPQAQASNPIHQPPSASSPTKVLLTWLVLGLVIRLMLSTSFSWLVMDSATFSFGLLFVAIEFITPADTRIASGGLVDILLRLSGISLSKISTFSYMYYTSKALINAFLIYFIAFAFGEVFIKLFQ
jgi:hypothetical protein